jgi:hypothetical protein
MKPSFWIKRFLVVFSGLFLVFFAVYVLLRGRAPVAGAAESALWAAITAGIFLATRLYRSSKGQPCELCGDTPETAGKGACPVPPNPGAKP